MVTTPAGGGADFGARLVAQGLSTSTLGQQVIVENRPSGIHSETVAKAQPDGYTLLFDGSYFWIAPLLQKMPYDPIKDFAPVSLTNRAPSILVVNPSLPVKSVKELIALAKAKPGTIRFSSGGIGASHHLAGEMFRALAHVDIFHVPYTGGGPATNAVLSGEVQMMFATGSALPLIKAGKLRALAIASAKPSPVAPDLPTVAASGVPGYESVNMNAILAPAKTPIAAIRRLNQEIVRVLNRDDIKEKFFIVGIEVVGSSPEELGAIIKSDMAMTEKLIKTAGIRAE
jgi:tripartite-type tricarboxylate transporter receptor subunit TctC